jgi:hypothetical protein
LKSIVDGQAHRGIFDNRPTVSSPATAPTPQLYLDVAEDRLDGGGALGVVFRAGLDLEAVAHGIGRGGVGWRVTGGVSVGA